MPRKARDPQDVKAKILNAALALFTKEGCKHITMNDIANSIHISKRTLYETYNDREQLLEDCCIYIKEETIHSITEASKNTQDTILKFLVNMRMLLLYGVRYHKFIRDMQDKYPVLYDTYFNLKNVLSRDALNNILQKGIDEGHILPIVPVNEFTRNLFLLGDMAYKAYPNDRKRQKYFVDFYSLVLIRGIMSDSAIIHYSEIMKQENQNSRNSKLYNELLKDLLPNGVSVKNYIIDLLSDTSKQIPPIYDNIHQNNHSHHPKQKAAKSKKTEKKQTVKDKYDAKMKERNEQKAKTENKTTGTKSQTTQCGRPRKNVVEEQKTQK